MRKRHVLADGLVCNNNTRRVNGNVTRHALQCHGGIDQLTVFVCIIVKLFQLGQLKRMLQGNAQLCGHGFGNGVHLSIRHAHGSAAIADGGTRSKRTKGNDLRHVFPAVPLCHVINDLVTAVIAEININIGHADAFGIEKTLKQQIIANGIHVGNAQRKRHKRACARASAGSYGNAAALGKAHVVLHDQKIIGISHLHDDVKLVLDSLTVGLLVCCVKGDLSLINALGKAALGKLVQVRYRVLAVGTREFGQVQRIKVKFHRAAVGNAHRVLQSTLVLREQHAHLARVFIVKFIGFKADRSAVLNGRVGLNAHQNCLRGGISAAQIVAVVGCHHTKPALARKAVKLRQDLLLLHHAVILQLDKEVILTKQACIFHGGLLGSSIIARRQLARNLARKACGKRDQPLVVRTQQLGIHARFAVKPFRKAFGYKGDQILIALLVFTQKNQVIRPCLAALGLFKSRTRGNVDLTADNGLDACFFARFIKLHHTVHSAVVGNGDSVVSAFGSACGDIRNTACAVQQTVFAVQMQVYEFVSHEISFLSVRQLVCQIDQFLQSVIQPRFGNGGHVRLGKLAKRNVGVTQAQHGGIAQGIRQLVKLTVPLQFFNCRILLERSCNVFADIPRVAIGHTVLVSADLALDFFIKQLKDHGAAAKQGQHVLNALAVFDIYTRGFAAGHKPHAHALLCKQALQAHRARTRRTFDFQMRARGGIGHRTDSAKRTAQKGKRALRALAGSGKIRAFACIPSRDLRCALSG